MPSTTKKLPPRSKVKTADTWDLSSLFPNDDAWEKAFAAWEKQIAGYARLIELPWTYRPRVISRMLMGGPDALQRSLVPQQLLLQVQTRAEPSQPLGGDNTMAGDDDERMIASACASGGAGRTGPSGKRSQFAVGDRSGAKACRVQGPLLWQYYFLEMGFRGR